MLPERPESVAKLAGIERAAPVFAALGDETRLRLVERLGTDGPLSITRLTSGSAVTRQAITKHLVVLASAGLVHDVYRGRERIWHLDKDRLAEAQRYLDQISQQWDDALDRLRQLVEE
jgi:DNA-binding transcriptional ArsR family regulator